MRTPSSCDAVDQLSTAVALPMRAPDDYAHGAKKFVTRLTVRSVFRSQWGLTAQAFDSVVDDKFDGLDYLDSFVIPMRHKHFPEQLDSFPRQLLGLEIPENPHPASVVWAVSFRDPSVARRHASGTSRGLKI